MSKVFLLVDQVPRVIFAVCPPIEEIVYSPLDTERLLGDFSHLPPGPLSFSWH